MKRPERRPSLERMTVQTVAERPLSTRQAASTRLTSLDGLRGVAALVVMLHHLYLVATPALTNGGGSAPGSPYWWMSETPLKILTAGSEAVLVFFVLSGLVVALPVLRKTRFSWLGFLTGRMARIYLPVWASLAIGTALIWLLPRDASAVTDGSWVDSSNATSATAGTLLGQASLTLASYGVNNVLWSLRWELAFSVLLPVFVAVAILVRRHWAIALGVAFTLSLAGALTGIDALQYLPVFFVGTLMAVRLDAILEWTRRRARRPRARLWGIALALGSLLLLVAHWLARPIAPPGTIPGSLLSQLAVLGAAGLVLAAIGVPFLRQALESPTSQWLGRVSFSLYLIHVPILATLSFLLGDEKWWLVALLTIPLALLAAWAFHRGIERPSHRLARRISEVVARGAAATGTRLRKN
jgi:peptidoglycan/LPS O-acetylase OafA/YrhL